jgi:chromosome segregation ATPase
MNNNKRHVNLSSREFAETRAYNTLKSDYLKLEQSHTKTLSKLQDITNELNKTKQENKLHLKDISLLKKSNESITIEKNQIETTLKENKAYISKLEHKIFEISKSKSQSLFEMNQKLTKENASYVNQISSYKNDIDSLNKEIMKLQKEINVLNNALEVKTTNLKFKNDIKSSIFYDVGLIKQELDDLKASTYEKDNTILTLQNDINKKNNLLQELTFDKTNMINELTSLRGGLQMYKEYKENDNKEIAKLNNQIETITKENETYKQMQLQNQFIMNNKDSQGSIMNKQNTKSNRKQSKLSKNSSTNSHQSEIRSHSNISSNLDININNNNNNNNSSNKPIVHANTSANVNEDTTAQINVNIGNDLLSSINNDLKKAINAKYMKTLELNKQLTEQVNQLEKENNQLLLHNKSLLEQNNQIGNQVDLISNKCNVLENKYNKEIEVLSNENGVLKKEIENLNKNKINSELAYDALVEENTNLKQQIKQLSLQIEKIRSTNLLLHKSLSSAFQNSENIINNSENLTTVQLGDAKMTETSLLSLIKQENEKNRKYSEQIEKYKNE